VDLSQHLSSSAARRSSVAARGSMHTVMSSIHRIQSNIPGVQYQGRLDVARTRQATGATDVVDRDEYVPGAGIASSNPYDRVMDRLRTAALRRDAAATAAKDTEDAKSSADDAVLAHDRRRKPPQ
jgi:hypothetical protein